MKITNNVHLHDSFPLLFVTLIQTGILLVCKRGNIHKNNVVGIQQNSRRQPGVPFFIRLPSAPLRQTEEAAPQVEQNP